MNLRGEETTEATGARLRNRWKRTLSLGAGAGLLLLLVVAPLLAGPSVLEPFRSRAALARLLDSTGPWAPTVFVLLQSAQVIAAPIPGHLLAVAGGFLFGFLKGALLSALGVGLGSAVVLILSRKAGRPVLEALVGHEPLSRADRWAASHGPLFFFLFFLLPMVPDDLACFAIGLSRLPVAPMLGLIVAARFPGHLLSAWIGANADRLSWWLVAALAVALAVVGWLYVRKRHQIESYLLRRIGTLEHGKEERNQTSAH